MLSSLLIDYSQIVSYVLIGVMVVILVVSMVLMNRRAKRRQQEAQDLIDAVKPGNKVKTIGGICGIVVEVDPEDDTFVLETGTESSGKCYIK
ncbi:MAG: preprotein translocase subunit YajC, partial [Clostridia bacterium]|nr:preprotein translocase subunit YajC [Clostridia bacterium]